ncbi:MULTISPECIES: hypothetical protein [unclassified Oceanispirochaeta]|uniref:hypothetical protein n=1 Tax=unclassified Oceanispirochaeta TaxID=2635722 RepID=UPI000E08FA12|nr:MULTISPECIES: hypothetical protein [unclassified Oceanispirochaeta]MBF9018689.1 hypothetical protein [Oceanispirochaeta sp. M2]NPD75136.1 hypothetical protein [Oceanispirochaeta sp. M1]RDG29021.1 hypothetical protein DV872_23855 [Oceanispirochaeta sp. M1]
MVHIIYIVYKATRTSFTLQSTGKPHHVSNKTPAYIEKQIISLRKKHPRWGAAKLLVLLEDRYSNRDLPKLTTINSILKRNGMIAPRKRRFRVEPTYPIFDPKAPNESWSDQLHPGNYHIELLLKAF